VEGFVPNFTSVQCKVEMVNRHAISWVTFSCHAVTSLIASHEKITVS
jgi:hypothetical protein